MIKKYIFYLLVFALVSCNQSNKAITPKARKEEAIVLGEDKKEINALVKGIYQKGEKVYIELDFVQIKYKNVDELVVVNVNPKIRTYLVDSNTLIYSKDCKVWKIKEVLQNKDLLVNDKNILLVGDSKKGVLISLNFGCYG